jgi:uncharacterized OB-fold protein
MDEAHMSELANDLVNVSRPSPRPFRFSKPFWDATREKKVLLQYCRATDRYQFFPKPISVFTGRPNLEWREVSGRGAIFSFTIARIGRPPFSGHTPYLIATVTLDEGVNLITNVIGCAIDRIAIGMRVRPAWSPLPDGTNLLLFEPDEPARSTTM